jgi:hypothetical protein
MSTEPDEGRDERPVRDAGSQPAPVPAENLRTEAEELRAEYRRRLAPMLSVRADARRARTR